MLERIARPSEGDARRAIAALRVGARLASREGLVDWLDRTPYSREVRGEVDLYPDR